MRQIDLNWIQKHVHPRQLDGHKKSFGHVLVIAGSEGKAGAAILCARAALHSGCGLVTAMIPSIAVEVLLKEEPALMYENVGRVQDLDLSVFDAIAIGPGLGCSEIANSNLIWLLEHYNAPLIIDADALTMLSTQLELLRSNHILTPHPGEFSKLQSAPYHALEREAQAQYFIDKYPCTLVLKGAGTLIGVAGEGLFQNTSGNDGMATAGAGDVLTGMIASICAQGYTPFNAACIGVYIHGMAGDLAIKSQSKASLVASNLIEQLGQIRLLD
jgi:NAD(P)H-hydrate epimerase